MCCHRRLSFAKACNPYQYVGVDGDNQEHHKPYVRNLKTRNQDSTPLFQISMIVLPR